MNLFEIEADHRMNVLNDLKNKLNIYEIQVYGDYTPVSYFSEQVENLFDMLQWAENIEDSLLFVQDAKDKILSFYFENKDINLIHHQYSVCSKILGDIEKNIQNVDLINEGEIFSINKLSSLDLWLKEKLQSVVDFITPSVDEKTVELEVTKLKNKFGFTNILIEKNDLYEDQLHWLRNMDKAITEVCDSLSIPYKYASLNSHLSIGYTPNYCKLIHALGCASQNSLILMNNNSVGKMKETWLHEFTHILDYEAGLKYFGKTKDYSRPIELYLSKNIALDNTEGSFSTLNYGSIYHESKDDISVLKQQISEVLGINSTEDSKDQIIWDVIPKLGEDLNSLFLIQLLNKNGLEYVSLSQNERFDFFNNNLHSLIRNICFNIAKDSTYTLSKDENEIKEYIESVSSHLNLDIPIEKIYENFIEASSLLKEEFLQVMGNNNMVVVNYLGQNFAYFTGSDYVTRSKNYSQEYSDNRMRLYFSDPVELLARYTEKLVAKKQNINEKYNVYPNHDLEGKQKAEALMNSLLNYIGLEERVVVSPSKNIVIDKLKSVREKIISSIEDKALKI